MSTQTTPDATTAASRDDDVLLSVEDLVVQFDTDGGTVHAVDGVSFDVHEGETLCIVGESGSGKTISCEAITRLFRSPPGFIRGGSVEFDGTDLASCSDKQLKEYRGDRIAHVFQNPQAALNPVYTIGNQVREAVELHTDLEGSTVRDRVVELLGEVGIPEPVTHLGDYPHELSGGMKQRVVIAMALAGEPDLLIADEPTTALDVTIQKQILDLLNDVQERHDMSVIFVTHDLGVVAQIADRVLVMYAGKVMERNDVFDLFESPGHPYTAALLDCLPGGSGGLEGIPGDLPDPFNPPDGCRFAERCPAVTEECIEGDQPPEYPVGSDDHTVSCVHHAPDGDPSDLDGVTGAIGGDDA